MRYIIFLFIFFSGNFLIAQQDTSFYAKLMEWRNQYSDIDIIYSFSINEVGDTTYIDTIKRYYHYGKLNKTYFIYHNNKIYKEIVYYKNRLFYEDIYDKGINVQRMAYSKKRPYHLRNVFYFNEKDR